MYATTARNRFMSDGVGSTPPERLLVLLYDRLLRDLDEASAAVVDGDVCATHEALSHAQDIVAELHSALDPERWDAAESMAGLYTWLADLLGRANIGKDLSLIAEARSLIEPLRDTWDEAYKVVSALPVPATAGPEGGLDVSG